LACQKIFCRNILRLFYTEKQEPAIPLGKECGSVAALLRRRGLIFINLLTFWSSHPASGLLSAQYRHTSPTRRFSKMRYDWMYSPMCIVNIKLRFRIAVDSISVCLKLIVIGVQGVMFPWRDVGLWRRSCFYQPKAQMIADIPDHLRVFNKADDPHRPLTFRADKGIYLVYLLKAKLHVHNQSGPVFPESLFVSLIFHDAGDDVIQTFLLAFAPRDVAVVSVILHHLCA
jgi:hypothetical protein